MAAPAYLQPIIRQAAARWGVDPAILSRLLAQESGYREGAVSPAGARDIAQFEPGTARQYGVRLGDNQPKDDIFGAAHYLHDALGRTGGSYAGALSIYNSGSPTGYQRIPETRSYVQAILGGHTPNTAAGAGGGAYGVTVNATPGKTTGGGFNAGGEASSAAALAALLSGGQQQRPVQTTPLQDPASSATRYLRTASGGAAPLASGGPAPRPTVDVGSLLSTLQDSQSIPHATSTPGNVTVNGQQPPPAGVTRARGVASFAGKPVAGWIAPILQYARQRGWTGDVTSGYRSYQQQANIYNSGRRPAARPGTSNHEFTAFPGGAVDVTQAQQLARILQGSPYARLLVWAGGKDVPHFSHPHNGGY